MRRFFPILAENARGRIVSFQNELGFKIKFLVGEQPRDGPQRLVGPPAGKKIEILLQVERTKPDPDAGLLIPDLVSHHGAEAQLRRDPAFLVQLALISGVQPVLGPGELLDLHGNIEVIHQDLPQSGRRTRPLRQKA